MGIDLHADLDLGLSIGRLTDEIRELRKSIVLPATVRQLTNTLAAPTGVAAPFIIPVGRPSPAVVWDTRLITVMGTDDHTAVANVNAVVYAGVQEQSVGQQARAKGSSELSEARWVGLTVPSSQTYNQQIPVLTGQTLYLAFTGTGVVATQQFTVTAVVIEIQVEDAPRYFG